MPACGRDSTPTCTSRSPASRSASTRSVTDLPTPGAPVTSAKPPSPASCSTRQQNDSIRGVSCRASAGTSGANGFHFKPYRASNFLFTSVLSFIGWQFIVWQVGGRQAGGGLFAHQLREERCDAGSARLSHRLKFKRFQRARQAGRVLSLVLWVEPAEDLAGLRIDQVNLR